MIHRSCRLLVGLGLAMALVLAAPARAIGEAAAADTAGAALGEPQPRPPGVGPLARLGRGLGNILVSPLEIPATMLRVGSEHNPIYGILAGGVEGLGNGIVRLGAGVLETATFFLPSGTLPLYNKRLGERALPPLRPPRDITRP